MKYRDELDEIFREVTATGKHSQGETPINHILLSESQLTVSVEEGSAQLADTQTSTSQPATRSSTPLKRDISQLLSNSEQLSHPSKKNKDGAMLLLIKQISNRLSNPSADSDLRVKAVELLQSKNNDMSKEEFNVALDIVEKHAAVYVTLIEARRSTWLSSKIEAAVRGS